MDCRSRACMWKTPKDPNPAKSWPFFFFFSVSFFSQPASTMPQTERLRTPDVRSCPVVVSLWPVAGFLLAFEFVSRLCSVCSMFHVPVACLRPPRKLYVTDWVDTYKTISVYSSSRHTDTPGNLDRNVYSLHLGG